MFVRTPVMFDTPADQGGGAPVATDPAPAPVTEAQPAPAPDPTQAVPAATEGEGVTPAAAPPAVNWEERVTEWGGEDSVTNAIELQRALGTPEGVRALFEEAGAALKLDPASIQQLLNPQAVGDGGEGAPTIEELLSDPDRVLTAGEVMQILQHQAQQSQAAQQQEQAVAGIRTTISTTLDELKVTDKDDKAAILAIADNILGVPTADATKIKSAITTAHARYMAKVQAEATAYVEGKAEAHGNLPSPLPAGGSAGGDPLPAPKDLAEAKQRVRKALSVS